MNKKTIILVSTLALTIIALLSVLGVFMFLPNRPSTQLENDFNVEMNNTEYVTLTMGQATATAGGGVSKPIKATIRPETATNKAVDWSVSWGDTSETGNVNEYVTVTPTAEGSLEATVTCYKAFNGEIIITVTTRESGYMASCIVTYAGIPTEIEISGEISPVNDFYSLGVGKAYTYNLTPTNHIGSIGSAYNNFSVTLTGEGSIKVGKCYHYNTSDKDEWYEDTMKTITVDSIKDEILEVAISNGKLTITTKKSIESYYKSSQRMDGGRTISYVDRYRESVGECYFIVTINEIASGLKAKMKIKFNEGAVTGVSVNTSEIVF